MDNYIKKLIRDFPNDAELGAAVRKYINAQRSCCDKPINQTTGLDGNMFCKKCGKLIP